MYEYNAKAERIVDGDTIDALVDLGFTTWKFVRIRVAGIDAPETRTKDIEEKNLGLDAKNRVISLLEANENKFRLVSQGVDKYGRCLGVIYLETLGDISLQDTLISEGHAVPYFGGKRD